MLPVVSGEECAKYYGADGAAFSMLQNNSLNFCHTCILYFLICL